MAARDKVARTAEIGGAATAGTVGIALAGEKLRDTYQRDYPKKYAHGAAHVERVSVASAGRYARDAGRVTRALGHGQVPFTALAAGTGGALVATGAKKYRKHRAPKPMPQPVAKAIGPVVPKAGYVKGIGKVQVLHYHGNGHFMVLDRRDTKRLVHRNKIRFSKALGSDTSAFGVGHIAKGTDALKAVGDVDDRVRRFRRKNVPSLTQAVARAGDATRTIVANEQAKLNKAYDPDRSAHRRARAGEAVLGTGATAAAIGSARQSSAGRSHLSDAATAAKTRDRNFAFGHRSMNVHVDGLDQTLKAKKQRKAVTEGALADSAHEARYARGKYRAGQRAAADVVRSTAHATGALRRARNLRVAAVGLGAGAVMAHRHADGNR